MRRDGLGNPWKSFLKRVVVLAIPVYVAAVIVWRYALGESWLYSLASIPLGLLIGGIIYSAVFSFFVRSRRDGAFGTSEPKGSLASI
jgi:hypothetical protein